MGLLSASDSQFYIGSLILAIEYLHQMSPIYRDLKPKNVIVDFKGNVILIDMGTAKILGAKNSIKKTVTILGTPHYMALKFSE
jgi:cGMP-dependent protein kinase 1